MSDSVILQIVLIPLNQFLKILIEHAGYNQALKSKVFFDNAAYKIIESSLVIINMQLGDPCLHERYHLVIVHNFLPLKKMRLNEDVALILWPRHQFRSLANDL